MKGESAFVAVLSNNCQKILLAIIYMLPRETSHFAFTTWSKQHVVGLALTKLRGSHLNNLLQTPVSESQILLDSLFQH